MVVGIREIRFAVQRLAADFTAPGYRGLSQVPHGYAPICALTRR